MTDLDQVLQAVSEIKDQIKNLIQRDDARAIAITEVKKDLEFADKLFVKTVKDLDNVATKMRLIQDNVRSFKTWIYVLVIGLLISVVVNLSNYVITGG